MKHWLPWLSILLLFLGGILVKRSHRSKKEVIPEKLRPAVLEVLPAPVVPTLLATRMGTLEKPLQSWERILASDGTPAEDRAALADVVVNYLQSVNTNQRPPLGTNEEITRALTDPTLLGVALIPIHHPAIIADQLTDRWGSPWFFHQISANLFEIRSAGPDRKLYTDDDLKE